MTWFAAQTMAHGAITDTFFRAVASYGASPTVLHPHHPFRRALQYLKYEVFRFSRCERLFVVGDYRYRFFSGGYRSYMVAWLVPQKTQH